MTLHELRDQRREEILQVAANHGARSVRVFGSVARGDSEEKSDVDFLVELEPGRTLFDLSGLLLDLESFVSASLKARHPEVDWRAISGFRNVLVHDYLGINLGRVWEIVSIHLPALGLQMEAIRREVGPLE